MYVVVCYDVVCDRRRSRLLRRMKGLLPHVQKSVFEGDLEEARMEALREMIHRVVSLEEDTVRVYHLCRRCVQGTELVGTGAYIDPDERDEVI